MALRMFTTVELFYFIMCEDLHEWKFIELALCWGPGHKWLRDHTTWSWDGLWTLSLGLSQFHGHGSWLVCEAEPCIGCPNPPMPMGFGWAWVRYYCSWVGMGGYCFHVGMDGHSFQVGTEPMPINIAWDLDVSMYVMSIHRVFFNSCLLYVLSL
jgi:hypothetical protein